MPRRKKAVEAGDTASTTDQQALFDEPEAPVVPRGTRRPQKMTLRALRSFFDEDSRKLQPGDRFECSRKVGELLISRGWAENEQ